MKNLLKKNDGFTLVELMISIVIIMIIILFGYVFLFKTVCQGNFWFSSDGVLRELQVDHPNVVKIIQTERNVFSNSVLTTEDGNSTRYKYCLDTDIFWNYEFSNCEE